MPAKHNSDNGASTSAPPLGSVRAAPLKPSFPTFKSSAPPPATDSAALGLQVIMKREQEPTEETPITYREYALAVRPGATSTQIEAVLQEQYKCIRLALSGRPAGKFVQLAVFDHTFKERPERPPLGTLVWKDWRGEPVVKVDGSELSAPGPTTSFVPGKTPVANSTPPAAPPSAAPSSSTPPSAGLPSSAAPIAAPKSASLDGAAKPSSIRPAPIVKIESQPPPAPMVAEPPLAAPPLAAARPASFPPAAPASIPPAPLVPMQSSGAAESIPPAPLVPVQTSPRPASMPPAPLEPMQSSGTAGSIPLSPLAPVQVVPRPASMPPPAADPAPPAPASAPPPAPEAVTAARPASVPPAAADPRPASVAPPAMEPVRRAPSVPPPAAAQAALIVPPPPAELFAMVPPSSDAEEAPSAAQESSSPEAAHADQFRPPPMSESRSPASTESLLASLPEPDQAPSGSVPVQAEAAPEVLPPPFEGEASLEPPPVIVTSGSPDPMPSVPVRRRTGEDLIGDLFETMHELHFMPDMVSGAEFVQNVLSQTLPCDGMLIHVFDIDKREFIVIRASGPNARDALLHITSDPDPLFSQVMRSPGVFRVDTARDDERFSGGRWEKVGVPVKTVLVGGVKQGGRYLGVIELANPMGGEPFSDGEVNALDYICGQFADFLVNRPIITDRDVVIGKS